MKIEIALLMIAFSLGCTHLPGEPQKRESGPERHVYEWSRSDRSHTIRKSVRKTVIEDDRACDDIRVRRSYFSELGELERRVVERRRCGYVEMRYVERYAPEGDVRIREVYLDKDHDGQFERQTVREEPVLGVGALTVGVQTR